MTVFKKIIFLLLSLSFLSSCGDPEEDKKYGYRLGDMVKDKYHRDAKDGRALHYRYFPNSIASEYMRRTDKDNDFELIDEIVKKRTIPSLIPPEKMMVVHLRIGDVIDKTPHLVKDFLSRHLQNNIGVNYVKPLSYYEALLAKMREEKLTSVTLLGGFHTHLKSRQKSLKYVRKIREFFEKNGIKVNERIDLNADDDFIYMCNAEYYAPSGGGYSKLVSSIVKLRGKNVFVPKK